MNTNGILFFLATLLGGIGLFYLIGGIPLALIYFIIWFDKSIIGLGGLIGRFGIELVTIPAVALGLLYGPVLAFLFLIIILPIVYAVKHLLLGTQSEWPLFVPSFWNLGHAIGGALAGLLMGMDIFLIFLIVLVAENIVFFIYELGSQRPMDFIWAAGNIIFNLVIYSVIALPLFAIAGLA